MKTLTRNRKFSRYVDGELTQEQMEHVLTELKQAEYERKMGIAKYYSEEEVMEGLKNIIEEAKRRIGNRES